MPCTPLVVMGLLIAQVRDIAQLITVTILIPDQNFVNAHWPPKKEGGGIPNPGIWSEFQYNLFQNNYF